MTTAPTTPRPASPTGPYDPIFGLQSNVASLMTPIVRSRDTDDFFAYQIASRSLQAYGPETRVDFVNAGRAIAFSLAAIALLAEAADPAMQLRDRMRILGHANALNRSTDQAERSMMDRRRDKRAYPTLPALQPEAPKPNEAPKPDEAQVQTQVAEPVATSSASPTTAPEAGKPGNQPRTAAHQAIGDSPQRP